MGRRDHRGSAVPYNGVQQGTNDFESCNNAVNKFYVSDMAAAFPNFLGVTDHCLSGPVGSQVIVRFQVTLDNDAGGPGGADWHSALSAPPAGDWDVKSIATHEIGHATGWVGHFSGGTDCGLPADADYNTMCVGNAALVGTRWLRTLATHDIHTAENEY